MNNILTAVFEDDKYCRVSGAWQYDYGQILRIQGLNLPKAVEIHFSLTEKTGDSTVRIGTTKDGITEVPIPDSMLEKETNQNYSIYAFVFLSDTTSGNTEYRIAIMVNTRPKPEAPGSPEKPEIFAFECLFPARCDHHDGADLQKKPETRRRPGHTEEKIVRNKKKTMRNTMPEKHRKL